MDSPNSSILRKEYPILEYDSAKEAVIEPSKQLLKIDIPEHCVLTYFQDARAPL